MADNKIAHKFTCNVFWQLKLILKNSLKTSKHCSKLRSTPWQRSAKLLISFISHLSSQIAYKIFSTCRLFFFCFSESSRRHHLSVWCRWIFSWNPFFFFVCALLCCRLNNFLPEFRFPCNFFFLCVYISVLSLMLPIDADVWDRLRIENQQTKKKRTSFVSFFFSLPFLQGGNNTVMFSKNQMMTKMIALIHATELNVKFFFVFYAYNQLEWKSCRCFFPRKRIDCESFFWHWLILSVQHHSSSTQLEIG